MPDNVPLTPGAQAIMRAQGLVDRGLTAARNYGNRQLTELRNAIPGTQNHDWRQTFDAVTNPIIPGDWYNSATGQWQNPLTGRPFGSPRAQQLQPGQVPHAGVPALDPTMGTGGSPALPNYTDPNAWGPPEHLAGAAPSVRPMPAPRAAAARGGGLRGDVIASGRNAQNMVEAMRGGSDPYARFIEPEVSPNNRTFKER
jgi:hypothetical protein